MTKTCTKCKEEKELSEFYIRNNKPISACKVCTKKRIELYNINNIEQIKLRKSMYRKANRDKIRESDKEFYKNNKKMRTALNKEWINNNTEKNKEYKRKWKRLHPENAKAYRRKRRAIKNNIMESYTKLDEEYTKTIFDNVCANCGSTEDLCIDHHKPLSKGYPLTRENAVVLCRSCNSSKQAKLPEDFYSPEKLQLIEEKLKGAV